METFLIVCLRLLYLFLSEGKSTYANGHVTLEDVLKFLSGCSIIPPGGFDSDLTLNFTEESRYPSVSTCTFTLTLPLNLNVYQRFKEILIESIISGPGFGNV